MQLTDEFEENMRESGRDLESYKAADQRDGSAGGEVVERAVGKDIFQKGSTNHPRQTHRYVAPGSDRMR
jgi:hypothetical protein